MPDRDPSAGGDGRTQADSRRADALRNDERILAAARRLLEQSPAASFSEIASAAGVSRSSLYRRFRSREALLSELEDRPQEGGPAAAEDPIPAGRLGRRRPVALDAIHVFDVVPPALLADQLVAEAERLAGVPVALYVLDVDGSHLLHMAGPKRLGRKLRAPLAVGPELDAEGVSRLREGLSRHRDLELFPLWLRGRATGALIVFGTSRESLTELARQAAAAVTLSDRYTDAFARAQRRVQPRAASEIQQSLLPPRISRVTGGEVAGNVLPSYEVAGDWFDVVENADGVWVSLADGLGGTTRSAASSAVALGALRASRRSGGTISEALLVMHQTLSEMPGPRAEMTALVARWDPTSKALRVANCGHVEPVVLRSGGDLDLLRSPKGRGLGGRRTPKPGEYAGKLLPGDRLLMVSDGVIEGGDGRAGLGVEGVREAAERSRTRSAANTVRAVHDAVLRSTEGDLADDATAVCLWVA